MAIFTMYDFLGFLLSSIVDKCNINLCFIYTSIFLFKHWLGHEFHLDLHLFGWKYIIFIQSFSLEIFLGISILYQLIKLNTVCFQKIDVNTLAIFFGVAFLKRFFYFFIYITLSFPVVLEIQGVFWRRLKRHSYINFYFH